MQNLTLMLLQQFRLGNNLPMHIRKNTDFPRQKPQQWSSAEANFLYFAAIFTESGVKNRHA